MSNTPAGWYPDGQGAQRWWDGNQWTEHTMPAQQPQQPVVPQAPVQPEPQQPAQPAQPDWMQKPEQPAQPAVDPHEEPTRVAGSPLPPAGPPAPTGPSYDQAAPTAGYPQQGYPQAGYPQQGGYPQQPGAWNAPYPAAPRSGGISGKLIAMIGGGVGVVVIVIVLLVVLLGGGGSPSSVAKDFLEKARDNDCSAYDDVSKELHDQGVTKKACQDAGSDAFGGGNDCGGAKISTSNEQVDGDTATVDAKVTGGGADCETSATLSLVKEDGSWKIASLNF